MSKYKSPCEIDINDIMPHSECKETPTFDNTVKHHFCEGKYYRDGKYYGDIVYSDKKKIEVKHRIGDSVFTMTFAMPTHNDIIVPISEWEEKSDKYF